jgi:hypothetical protein
MSKLTNTEFILLKKADLLYYVLLESKIILEKLFLILLKYAKELVSKSEWSQVIMMILLKLLRKNVESYKMLIALIIVKIKLFGLEKFSGNRLED